MKKLAVILVLLHPLPALADGMGMRAIGEMVLFLFLLGGASLFGLFTLIALLVTLLASRPSSRAPFVLALLSLILSALWTLVVLLLVASGEAMSLFLWVAFAHLAFAIVVMVISKRNSRRVKSTYSSG